MNTLNFHFLRPEWLAALALLPVMGWAWYRQRESSGWERVCEPHLLRHLLTDGGGRAGWWFGGVFALAWVGGCLALAGPTWERLPQPAFEDATRTVLVLSLAPSMQEGDVAPTRIARARHKLQDAVNQLPGGSAALVVYREEAFAAVPLTDDFRVLEELIPLLDTDLAPGSSVFPARGIEAALDVLKPVGVAGARILLVTDGSDDDPKATLAAARTVAQSGARLSVLGVAGAPAELAAVARAGGGDYAELRPDDRDLASLLVSLEPGFGSPLQRSEAKTDAWRDMGVWLVWIPLVFAPLAFRKGWATAAMALLALQLPAGSARADLLDWFERPDQRGARAFAEEDYEASANAFEDPAWQAAARYRAGDFAAAAQALAGRADAQSNYNRGNALAKAGQLEQALTAYDASLAETPDDADTRFNRELVKRLLEERQQNSDSSSQHQDSGSQNGEQGDNGENETSDSGAGASDAADSSPDSQASQSGGDDASQGDAEPEGEQETEPETDAAGGDERETTAQSAGASQRRGDEAGDEDPERPTQSGDLGEAEPQEDSGQARGASPADQSAAAGDEAPQVADRSPTGLGEARSRTPGAPRSPAPISPQDQEMARWMARLPDDPGGLLREKIRRDYLRKRGVRQENSLR